MTPGCVYLVGAGPGDPGLITVKGLTLLRGADVVIYDRLVSRELLDEVAPDAIRINAGKVAGCHAIDQNQINTLLVQHASGPRRRATEVRRPVRLRARRRGGRGARSGGHPL